MAVNKELDSVGFDGHDFFFWTAKICQYQY